MKELNLVVSVLNRELYLNHKLIVEETDTEVCVVSICVLDPRIVGKYYLPKYLILKMQSVLDLPEFVYEVDKMVLKSIASAHHHKYDELEERICEIIAKGSYE